MDAESGINVVDVACNGDQAVRKFAACRPDVVVLDIEMPKMDGVAATREIRKLDPSVPILIFSSLTTAGGKATLNALTAGANDCIAKPSNCGSLDLAIEQLKSELIPAIKNHAGQNFIKPEACQNQHQQPQTVLETTNVQRHKTTTPPKLVVIGVSTGGPAALATLLNRLPNTFAVPVLVVQHMPPTFTRLLAERLDKSSALTVVEATHDSFAEPGQVIIAPGSHHLRVAQACGRIQLHLDEGQPENSCRPAVDVLFRSAAMSFGGHVLGVVLTGMGKDGLAGAKNIKDGGGYMIVQDECSSTIWGMPGEIARAGLADQVLPLDQIASTLTRHVKLSKELVRR